MKLVLLGTAGYHPSPSRQTACFMLPEIGVVLDAGTGMFRVRDWLTTETLDIFLTHAHLDHCVGLTYLIDVLHDRAMRHVVVHGQQVKLDAIREHLFSEHLFPVPPRAEFRPLEGPLTLHDGGVVRSLPLAHPGGSLGYRVDWPNRSLAYITDTTASASAAYADFVHGVDVLVHECNFGDEQAEWAEKTGHSACSAVAQLARRAAVGRLVLVHVDPLADDAAPLDLPAVRRIFAAAEIGRDQMVVEF